MLRGAVKKTSTQFCPPPLYPWQSHSISSRPEAEHETSNSCLLQAFRCGLHLYELEESRMVCNHVIRHYYVSQPQLLCEETQATELEQVGKNQYQTTSTPNISQLTKRKRIVRPSAQA
eukprot:72710-Amphidinium_carterae.1